MYNYYYYYCIKHRRLLRSNKYNIMFRIDIQNFYGRQTL